LLAQRLRIGWADGFRLRVDLGLALALAVGLI
jgi:hypothetical protein